MGLNEAFCNKWYSSTHRSSYEQLKFWNCPNNVSQDRQSSPKII